jgi:hypothetical protein
MWRARTSRRDHSDSLGLDGPGAVHTIMSLHGSGSVHTVMSLTPPCVGMIGVAGVKCCIMLYNVV